MNKRQFALYQIFMKKITIRRTSTDIMAIYVNAFETVFISTDFGDEVQQAGDGPARRRIPVGILGYIIKIPELPADI